MIVLGSVGSGSEILAGGSVHVYGTLRGRAFAGATGMPSARIFCRKNEAELLSVDGWYRTAEDMEPSARSGRYRSFSTTTRFHRCPQLIRRETMETWAR